MKRYFFTFLLVLVVALVAVGFLGINFIRSYITDLSGKFQNTTVEVVSESLFTGKYTYYSKNGIKIQSGDFDINVFKSPDSKLYTPKKLALENNNQVVINGGYFTETKAYIGLLWDGQTRFAPLSASNPQATHVAHFNKNSKLLDFISSSEFTNSDFQDNSDHIYFQTGPIIIDRNEVQNTFIDRSLNGNQSSLRSFIGFTESGKIFVGTTSQGYDLRSLGKMLITKDFFEGEVISVINLDGGSSTALYSAENPEISFRDFKELPYLIEFK